MDKENLIKGTLMWLSNSRGNRTVYAENAAWREGWHDMVTLTLSLEKALG